MTTGAPPRLRTLGMDVEDARLRRPAEAGQAADKPPSAEQNVSLFNTDHGSIETLKQKLRQIKYIVQLNP